MVQYSMEIRFANNEDDKRDLARLIYQVDPYIYPYWFNDNQDDGILVLTQLLNDVESIFYFKNCIIAKENDQIVGIFSFIPPNAKLNLDYSKYDVDFRSHHVIQNYIVDVIQNLVKDDVCVVGLFVDPKYRRRNIATKMFCFLFDNIKSKTCTLEVLADNNAAIELYNKFSFEISKTYYGYNGYKRRKPLCHIMTRISDRSHKKS